MITTRLTLMKGDKAVNNRKCFCNCFLFLIIWERNITFQSIFSRYFHIVFRTFINEWVHIIVHSCVLLKVGLHKVRIRAFLRMINSIQG